MKAQAILTTLWIVCLVIAILLVEGYFRATDDSGFLLLLSKDRVPVYLALGALYGGPIGAILACWYLKPFKPPKRAEFHRFMTALAVAVTLIYNLVLLYLLAQGHFDKTESIADILASVKTIGGALAFLTVPVNAYYFGLKPPT